MRQTKRALRSHIICTALHCAYPLVAHETREHPTENRVGRTNSPADEARCPRPRPSTRRPNLRLLRSSSVPSGRPHSCGRAFVSASVPLRPPAPKTSCRSNPGVAWYDTHVGNGSFSTRGRQAGDMRRGKYTTPVRVLRCATLRYAALRRAGVRLDALQNSSGRSLRRVPHGTPETDGRTITSTFISPHHPCRHRFPNRTTHSAPRALVTDLPSRNKKQGGDTTTAVAESAKQTTRTRPLQVGHETLPSRRLSVRLISPAPLHFAHATTCHVTTTQDAKQKRQRARDRGGEGGRATKNTNLLTPLLIECQTTSYKTSILVPKTGHLVLL